MPESSGGELFIRQQFFKELEISDQEMEQHPIAPTCYHYISHIYRQFGEPNLGNCFCELAALSLVIP